MLLGLHVAASSRPRFDARVLPVVVELRLSDGVEGVGDGVVGVHGFAFGVEFVEALLARGCPGAARWFRVRSSVTKLAGTRTAAAPSFGVRLSALVAGTGSGVMVVCVPAPWSTAADLGLGGSDGTGDDVEDRGKERPVAAPVEVADGEGKRGPGSGASPRCGR